MSRVLTMRNRMTESSQNLPWVFNWQTERSAMLKMRNRMTESSQSLPKIFGIQFTRPFRTLLQDREEQDMETLFVKQGHKAKLVTLGHFYVGMLRIEELPHKRETYMSVADYMRWKATATDLLSRKTIYDFLPTKGIQIVDLQASGVDRAKCPHDSLLKSPVVPKRWDPPEKGYHKLNFDGAFWDGKGGWGAVLRDHNSEIIDIFSGTLPNIGSAYECELIALYNSLHKAWKSGIRKLIVEGDCQNLIDRINGDSPAVDAYSDLYCQILELKSRFEECHIRHQIREANDLADYVAKEAMNDRPRDRAKVRELAELEKMKTNFRIASLFKDETLETTGDNIQEGGHAGAI